jgi:hypothetical protein
MTTNSAPVCQHIRTTGSRCGSPALQKRRFCYYHQAWRPAIVNLGKEESPLIMVVPVLEDAHAIQFALAQTMQRLLNQTIGTKTAGLMFYALQIASSNLKQMKEPPPPEDVVANLDAVHQPQLESNEQEDNGKNDAADNDKNDAVNSDKQDRDPSENRETTYIQPLREPTYVPAENPRLERRILQGPNKRPLYSPWEKLE